MSTTEYLDLDTDQSNDPPPPARDTFRLALIAVLAVAALVIAGGVGWISRGDGGSAAGVTTESSVDAGFARDMSTHHTQAVIMAGYERDNTTNPDLKNLAFDIEYTQNQQIGEMTGWLDSWGLSRSSSIAVMQWMGGVSADGMSAADMAAMTASSTADPGDTSLMPGMATPNQLTAFEKMTGTAMDVRFLQLMLRHHQGGLEMAQYAALHASHDYVRNLAQQMVDSQNNEITVMTNMLAKMGAKPLT